MRWFFVPVGARYINRQVLGIFLAALTILLSIALGDKLIQFLEKAAAGSIPTDRVFYIVLLRMPELVQLVLPFALYIALLMGLGRLYSSQEMAVLRSGGMSTQTLLVWLMPVILLVTLLVGIASAIAHAFSQIHARTRAGGTAETHWPQCFAAWCFSYRK